MDAQKPIGPDGRTHHLRTREGDIAKNCLLCGDPKRSEMIAREFFDKDAKLVGDNRGLKTFTGSVAGVPISAVTTGMGSASCSNVLPEAYFCGARRFIRVGSCSTLWTNPKPGDSVICTAAVRYDGASNNWAPIEYPAVADFRVVNALIEAAIRLNLPHYVGIGATTSDFVEGQGRRNVNNYLSPQMLMRHEEIVKLGILFYSMEEATLFTWCTTHFPDLWAGAVDAIFGNRQTNEFAEKGEKQAAQIAIEAMINLNSRFPLT